MTTVIGTGLAGYSKDALMAWAWREGKEGRDYKQTSQKAADTGTVAHNLIEAFLHGIEPDLSPFTSELIAEAQPCFAAFQEWSGKHELVIAEQEIKLVSAKHRFGGTFDALGTIDGIQTVFDWKSSKALYSSYVVQVAAYFWLITENRPRAMWPKQAVIVRVGKDGKLNVVNLCLSDLEKGWTIFKHALAIHNARWDLEKIIKPVSKEPRKRSALPVVNELSSVA